MARFAGRYADGRTAQLDPVSVELDADRLLIDGADRRLASWQRGEVRLVAGGEELRGVRLASAADPDARLAVADDGFLAALTGQWPELTPRRRARHVRAAWLAVLAAGALGVAGLLFMVVLPNSADTLAGWVPPAWERALGERAEKQLDALLGGLGTPPESCEEDPGISLLRGLADRLARAGRLPTPVSLRVLDSEIVNAVALPGGRILVFAGLIDEAKSPDELAGVVAHEIGHLKRRHVMSRLIRTLGLDLLIGMMTGGGIGSGNLAVIAVSNSNSREAEAEADAEALAMLSAAGIDTKGLGTFFARLAEKEGGGLFGGLLATHPPSALRARHAAAMAAPGAPALSSDEWREVRRVCGAEE